MDRLSVVAALAVLLLGGPLFFSGCSGGGEDTQMSRVAAVKARPGSIDPSRMCGTYYPSDRAPVLQLPSLESARPGESVPPLPTGRWLWINLWATWCGPCIREMPLIESWKTQLGREGVPLEVWYVSVDEDREVLVRFLRRNPQVAPGTSLRVTSLDALGPWLRPYNLEANQAPIHLIADPQGRIRCAHVGALLESDFPRMRELLR